MKRFSVCLSVLLMLFAFSIDTPTYAQPPQEELDQFLADINWTQEDLVDYLSFYEQTLEDFSTIEELKEVLGTPINDQNLQDLLTNKEMTREELDLLLSEFGESVSDYTFIEDLDAAVDFYKNHDQEMAEIDQFLAQIGLQEEEVNRLFDHISQLDEETMTARLEAIDSELEKFINAGIDDPTQLTDQQVSELLTLWQQILDAYEVDARFYLVGNGTKQPATYQELINLQSLNGKKLRIELYDLKGNLLADMEASEDFLLSDDLLNAGEEMIHVGEIASELNDHLHGEKLPKTASPYLLNMLFGIFVLSVGGILYLATNRRRA